MSIKYSVLQFFNYLGLMYILHSESNIIDFIIIYHIILSYMLSLWKNLWIVNIVIYLFSFLFRFLVFITFQDCQICSWLYKLEEVAFLVYAILGKNLSPCFVYSHPKIWVGNCLYFMLKESICDPVTRLLSIT